MSDSTDLLFRTSEEVHILKHDAAIFKNLIKERQHPLDLVRELLSNAAAREVAATRIEITYHHDGSEHIFEVAEPLRLDTNDGSDDWSLNLDVGTHIDRIVPAAPSDQLMQYMGCVPGMCCGSHATCKKYGTRLLCCDINAACPFASATEITRSMSA